MKNPLLSEADYQSLGGLIRDSSSQIQKYLSATYQSSSTKKRFYLYEEVRFI